MSQYLPGLLVVIPLMLMTMLYVFRPKNTDKSVHISSAGPKPMLDLGGMALAEVLRRFDEVIGKLGSTSQDTEKKELSDIIVVMARSALSAYIQSVEWRMSRELLIDLSTSKSMSENMLDAMKLLDIGSPSWCELKSEVDSFHSYVLDAMNRKTTQQQGTGTGGSTPPPLITSA